MKLKSNHIFLNSLLLGSLVFGATGALAQPSEQPATLTLQRNNQVEREIGTFAKLARDLKPAVVNITVVKSQLVRTSSSSEIPERFRELIPREMWPEFRRSQPKRRARGQGSGVLISTDGEILTNNHVVDNAEEIEVKLNDGRVFQAQVVGRDPNTDLALIKLLDARHLPVASLGDSESLMVGDWVMAIGNPFGLEATVTVGVLSGKGRTIGAGPYDDYLQTDASINPGNSGGPLFNIAGDVVGINTAIVRGGQGIGFSIPINLAREVAAQLREDGKVRRGYIGVGIQPLTPKLRSALGLPQNSNGALVSEVLSDGPADKAGIKESDLIVKVNGFPVSNNRELLKEVAKLPPGRSAPISVLRGNKERTLTLNIAERPSQIATSSKPDQTKVETNHSIGLSAEASGVEDGVVVTKVEPNSRAARAGIRPGDLIRRVGKRKVSNLSEFRGAVAELDELAFLVERNGRSGFVVID